MKPLYLIFAILVLAVVAQAQDTRLNTAGQITRITVATLGTPDAVGPATPIRYVVDGTAGSNPCTGSGSGSLAVWTGTQWNCAFTGGGGGGGTPGGANTQVQFNDSGSFGGSANFTFTKANGNAILSGSLTTGNGSGSSGCLSASGATSGAFVICAASVAGTANMKWPIADGTAHQRLETDGAGQLSFASTPYDIPAQVNGAPTSSQVILRRVSVRSFTLSASGHQCTAGTAATAQTDFLVAVNGTTKATLRFAPAGTTCSIVGGVQASVNSLDVITITAPGSADATLANIGFTLFGTYP